MLGAGQHVGRPGLANEHTDGVARLRHDADVEPLGEEVGGYDCPGGRSVVDYQDSHALILTLLAARHCSCRAASAQARPDATGDHPDRNVTETAIMLLYPDLHPVPLRPPAPEGFVRAQRQVGPAAAVFVETLGEPLEPFPGLLRAAVRALMLDVALQLAPGDAHNPPMSSSTTGSGTSRL